MNLFLVRSDAIDVTGIVCGELDQLIPAAVCTELRDCLPGGLLREVLRYGGCRRGGVSLRPQPCPERGLWQAGGRGF